LYDRNLADLNRDGKLDVNEFILTLLLIHRIKSGQLRHLPSSLPASLSLMKKKDGEFLPLSPSSSSLSGSISSSSSNNSSRLPSTQVWTTDILMQPSEIAKYQKAFDELDKDKKNYLNGVQAKEFLMKSNLSQATLAQIWHLADVDQDGQLGRNEFCIAMYLIFEKLRGRELPGQLPDELLHLIHASMPQTASASMKGNDMTAAHHYELQQLREQHTSEQEKKAAMERQLAMKQIEIEGLQATKNTMQQDIERLKLETHHLQQKLLTITQSYDQELEMNYYSETLKTAQKEHEALQAEVEKKSDELRQIHEEKNNQIVLVQELQTNIKKYREQLKQIQEEMTHLKKQVGDLNREKKQLGSIAIVHEQLVRSAMDEKTKLEEVLTAASQSTADTLQLSSTQSDGEEGGKDEVSSADTTLSLTTTMDSAKPIPGGIISELTPPDTTSSSIQPSGSDIITRQETGSFQEHKLLDFDTILKELISPTSTNDPQHAFSAFHEAFTQLHTAEPQDASTQSPFFFHDHSPSIYSKASGLSESQEQLSHDQPTNHDLSPQLLSHEQPCDPSDSSLFQHEIELLEAMGFQRNMIVPALRQTVGNVNEATELLLNPDTSWLHHSAPSTHERTTLDTKSSFYSDVVSDSNTS
jgi:hypothetical protein